MKFGLFYMFGDFGTTPQDQLFHEILEEIAFTTGHFVDTETYRLTY